MSTFPGPANQNVGPPKYLCWPKSQSIDQTYVCDFDLLITGGCSFTASTMWFDGAASWPGHVKDRCGIEKAIDMSYPGAGNLFIADSVKFALSNLCDDYASSSILVAIMWSGIDRQEIVRPATETEISQGCHPIINKKIYFRTNGAQPSGQHDITKETRQKTTLLSRSLILEMIDWLDSLKVKWIFTSYANLLYPPFIPKRDTTHHWLEYLDKVQLQDLYDLPWLPKDPMDYLFEWSWKNDYLNQGDFFHPPIEANLAWSDQVFLPEIEKLGLIFKKPQGTMTSQERNL